MPRERLGSRLGFILLSAGRAIGVGNVWKFPWMVGQYGGGARSSCAMCCSCSSPVSPIMTMEFAIGRAEPEKSGAGVSGAREAGQQVAHPRLSGDDRQLPADDVLHHRVRLDAVLLYPTVSGRFVGATSEQVQAALPEMLGKPVVMAV